MELSCDGVDEYLEECQRFTGTILIRLSNKQQKTQKCCDIVYSDSLEAITVVRVVGGEPLHSHSQSWVLLAQLVVVQDVVEHDLVHVKVLVNRLDRVVPLGPQIAQILDERLIPRNPVTEQFEKQIDEDDRARSSYPSRAMDDDGGLLAIAFDASTEFDGSHIDLWHSAIRPAAPPEMSASVRTLTRHYDGELTADDDSLGRTAQLLLADFQSVDTDSAEIQGFGHSLWEVLSTLVESLLLEVAQHQDLNRFC